MDNKKAIATLNSLIQTCKDGEEGFRTAADGITDAHVQATFEDYSRQRAKFARELQQEVQKLGGTAETSGSLSGSVHRGWINIKSLVTRKDEQAILAEAERGEDVAKAAFENAVLEEWSAGTTAIIRHMLAQVREAHDRVRAMEKAGAR